MIDRLLASCQWWLQGHATKRHPNGRSRSWFLIALGNLVSDYRYAQWCKTPEAAKATPVTYDFPLRANTATNAHAYTENLGTCCEDAGDCGEDCGTA